MQRGTYDQRNAHDLRAYEEGLCRVEDDWQAGDLSEQDYLLQRAYLLQRILLLRELLEPIERDSA